MAKPLTFHLAGVTVALESEHAIKLLDGFRPFVTDAAADYIVRFEKVKQLPATAPVITHEASGIMALCADGSRIFYDAKDSRQPYAVTAYDWHRRRINVSYLPWAEHFFSETGNSFFHIGVEAVLQHEKRLILHAACVTTPYGGLLFSGPPGIGKSTQAELWCQHGGGRLINGDRTILHRENEVWYGYGSPYAGSSRCYVNERCAVRAVVLLRQGPQNDLRRMPVAEAFRRIYAELTVNVWSAESVDAACDLTGALLNDVPAYELTCRPDTAAVEILRKELEESADESR